MDTVNNKNFGHFWASTANLWNNCRINNNCFNSDNCFFLDGLSHFFGLSIWIIYFIVLSIDTNFLKVMVFLFFQKPSFRRIVSLNNTNCEFLWASAVTLEIIWEVLKKCLMLEIIREVLKKSFNVTDYSKNTEENF